MTADYDALAWFYDRYWRTRYHHGAEPALARLVYDRLAPGSRVLDLCCGTGHLSRILAARGYRVVGIDRSLEMLRVAKASTPSAAMICADARAFELRGADAVLSTFDSVNHLLTVDDLRSAFAAVARALSVNGLFVFDVNMADAYASEWGKSSAVVDADAAIFVRGDYDPATQIGTTVVTMFRLNGGWHRTDAVVRQRCYDDRDIRAALLTAGFADIESMRAVDAGMTGDIAVGRWFYRCRVDGGEAAAAITAASRPPSGG